MKKLLELHLFLVEKVVELGTEFYVCNQIIIDLTSYSDMLGIVILLEGNISACDHAHEVAAGDQANIGQGQMTG